MIGTHNIESTIAAGDEKLAQDEFLKAKSMFDMVLETAQRHGLREVEARTLNRLSGVMDVLGIHDKSVEYVSSAMRIYRELKDERGEAVCLCNLGGIKASSGEFSASLVDLAKALDIVDRLGDTLLQMQILLNIGYNCSMIEMYQESIGYFKEAEAKSLASQNVEVNIHALLNLATSNLNLGNRTLALEYFLRAKNATERTSYHDVLAQIMAGLGKFHDSEGNWQESIENYSRSFDLAASIDFTEGLLESNYNLGRINIDHGDPSKAAQQLSEALRLATQLDRPKSRRDAHQHLARLHKKTGETALALEHFEAYHEIERELFSAERDKTTRTLMMQFDVERAQTTAETERERRDQAEQAQATAEALVRERTAELERSQMEVVGRLAMAAEFRDDMTGEHTRRVGIGAALIAEGLGMPPIFVETLRVAARLHDVGKIGVSDTILLKEGRLTPGEFDAMKRHTVIGAQLLSGGQSEVLDMARLIALTHHERWDGSGYPSGLSGAGIPLVGRIVALADVFDALVHTRPYKSAWKKEEALAELVRQRGQHFDPELVDLAAGIFGSGQYEAALLDTPQEDRVLPRREGLSEWEVESLRQQYEQQLAERTQQLDEARRAAEVQAEQMRQAAHTDALTGLYNRRAFEADLPLYFGRAVQENLPLSVVSLDVDDLKLVNDQGGHAEGDQLLLRLGQQLERHFGVGGQVYRMGGDEFVALLWGPAERVRLLLDEWTLLLARELPGTGMSWGHACWPHDAGVVAHHHPADLLRLSDERMYAHKRGRKGRPGPF